MTKVCDTSAIIHDPSIITEGYPGEDIILPLVVIQELDKLKTQKGTKGFSARRALEYLDDAAERSSEGLSEGTARLCGGTVRVELNHVDVNAVFPKNCAPTEGNDSLILSVVANLTQQTGKEHTLLTQDRAMLVLASALGIKAERHDLVPTELHPGVVETSPLTPDMIAEIYAEGEVYHPDFEDIPVNTGVVISEGSSSVLALSDGFGTLHRLGDEDYANLYHCTPKGVRQKFASALLTGSHHGEYPEEFLGAISGRSGSGKTTLAVSAGLEGVSRGIYDRVMVFRPTMPVGRDIGFIPGSVDEKMKPWSAAVTDILHDLGADVEGFIDVVHPNKGESIMQDVSSVISVEPMSYVRGRSLRRTFVIIDEAQNCDAMELRTLASRCGQGSACVLTFDPSQIDNAYLRSGRAEGVEAFLAGVQEHPMSWHIELDSPLRGGVSAIVD